MNVSAVELARLSDVAAVISTHEFSTARMKRLSAAIVMALKTVERGYFRHVNLSSKDEVQKRLYRRFVTALNWYRQSFGSLVNESEAVVAIAVAFETLLTDAYQKGVAERTSAGWASASRASPASPPTNRRFSPSTTPAARSCTAVRSASKPISSPRTPPSPAAFTCSSRLRGWTPVANEPIRDLLQDG